MILEKLGITFGRCVRFSVASLALILGSIPLLSNSYAASLSLDELRVLSRNDRFGTDDEVYLVITVARADGSFYAYSQPVGAHWSLRAGQAVINQALWQEWIPLYGRAFLTVTVLEKDGSSQGEIYLSANEFAARVRNELMAARIPVNQGALSPQFLSQLTPAVLTQNGRWHDDDVIAVYALDYFNDGVQVRAGLSPLYAGNAGWINPFQVRANAYGDGSNYGLTFQLRSY